MDRLVPWSSVSSLLYDFSSMTSLLESLKGSILLKSIPIFVSVVGVYKDNKINDSFMKAFQLIYSSLPFLKK